MALTLMLRVSEIYQKLPIDAQKELIDNYLLPLLDAAPKERARQVLAVAAKREKRYAGMPKLEHDAWAIELNDLMLELDKDQKLSLLKDRSRRDEIVGEMVDSMIGWMNDIWSVVYEYQANFALAHRCLLLVARTISTLSPHHGGCANFLVASAHPLKSHCRCGCAFRNMYISAVIKQKSGKTIKAFQLTGAHKINKVLQWIWRDLFLTLLATGNEAQKKQVPDMLQAIDRAMGWTSLEHILTGGRVGVSCVYFHSLTSEDLLVATGSDEDVDEDEDVDDCDDDTDFGDDDDAWEDDDSEDEDFRDHARKCPFHADHWSLSASAQMIPLRYLVEQHLTNVFALTPNPSLYRAVLRVTSNYETARLQLIELARVGALTCSESFVGALNVFTTESRPDLICRLLDKGSHLLRPRDASALQDAILIVSANRTFGSRAVPVIERELLDTARAIKAGLLASFSHLTDPAKLVEMKTIAALPEGSLARQARVEQWTDSVMSPEAVAPHPMAFAAMIMGIPIPVPADMDSDPIGFLDMDTLDPDLEELRDEFRPKLKERFDGWRETAQAAKNGIGCLVRVYEGIVQMMPFLDATDIVEEMLARYVSDPSHDIYLSVQLAASLKSSGQAQQASLG